MEIDLDDIDFSQIPGYIPITSATPNWKRDMIDKKNREKLEEYVTEMRRRKAEEDKWRNVPEWKRKLMMEKEQQKRDEDIQREQAALELKRKQAEKIPAVLRRHQNFANQLINEETAMKTPPVVSPIEPPKQIEVPKKSVAPLPNATPQNIVTNQQVIEEPPKTIVSPDISSDCTKEDEVRRREEKQRQIEMEKDLEEDETEMPAWKREVMMKRGTAPKNWGDEREEENQG